MCEAVAPLLVVDVPRPGRGDEVVRLAWVILKAIRKRREGTEGDGEDSEDKKEDENYEMKKFKDIYPCLSLSVQ